MKTTNHVATKTPPFPRRRPALLVVALLLGLTVASAATAGPPRTGAWRYGTPRGPHAHQRHDAPRTACNAPECRRAGACRGVRYHQGLDAGHALGFQRGYDEARHRAPFCDQAPRWTKRARGPYAAGFAAGYERGYGEGFRRGRRHRCQPGTRFTWHFSW